MAPLTRNKQAALQAHPLPHTSTSSPSLSATLRAAQSGQDADASSRSLDSVLQRTEASSRNQSQQHHDTTHDQIPESPHEPQLKSLTQYGNLQNLDAFNSPANASQHSQASLATAMEQNGMLRGSADWSTFANSASMTDELYQNDAGNASLQSAPVYSMQEEAQRSQEENSTHQPIFINSFAGMQHANGPSVLAWKQQGPMHLPPSPTDTMPPQEGIHSFYQHTQSMGQVGRDMNEGLLRNGLLRLNNGGAAFGDSTRRVVSQSSSSLRSPSPSDRSISSNALFGDMSPHTSISTRRHGDSSVDTSIDSISNSVTSMSTNPSRSSSTSDEVMSTGSSRKLIKGKTRLRNIDRKLICEAARDDPKIRQEDLAFRFGIERSTVSKTLKNKDKWLVIKEESDGAMIIKHRSGKFPELEETLAQWARSQMAKGHAVLDVALRNRALEIAKAAGLGVETFKASVGWIEKFRDRHDLSKTNTDASLPSATRSDRVLTSTKEQGPSLSLSSTAASRIEAEVMPQRDVEMRSTPYELTLRSQTSSSTISTSDESYAPTTQETPKAAKRHYDDMDAYPPFGSSIDSGMANLQFGLRASNESLLSLDQEMTSPITGTSKRRRGGREVAALSSQQAIAQEDTSRSWPLSTRRRGIDAPRLQLTGILTVANAPTMMDMQQQSAAYRDPASEGISRSRDIREVASSMQQSPSLGQSQEQTQAAASSLAGFHDERIVTTQEAKDCLDLVLAFIARQPVNLSPSDYFVLGNLQGTLSALAGQSQTPDQSQSQHQHQQQHQQQQQHHHPQQQQQQQQLLSPVHLSTTNTSAHLLYHEEAHQQQPRRSHP
jgi:hypothetical protein